MRAGEVSVWNLKPASSQHVFALRKWPEGALDGSLSVAVAKKKKKNHSHHWPELASNFGEAQSRPLFAVVSGTTVMPCGCGRAIAFDVSSFAVIDRCWKEPNLARRLKKGKEGCGGGGNWEGEAGRRGWVEGGKGKERTGPLGSCWEPAVDRCKKKKKKVREGEGKRALPEA